MDDIETLLNRIFSRIVESGLPEAEKQEIYAQLNIGMHHLVWPILVSHVPQYLMEDAVRRSKEHQFTADDYVDLVESAIKNPATPKEIHDEVKVALVEVDELLVRRLPAKAA